MHPTGAEVGSKELCYPGNGVLATSLVQATVRVDPHPKAWSYIHALQITRGDSEVHADGMGGLGSVWQTSQTSSDNRSWRPPALSIRL